MKPSVIFKNIFKHLFKMVRSRTCHFNVSKVHQSRNKKTILQHLQTLNQFCNSINLEIDFVRLKSKNGEFQKKISRIIK